MTSLTSVNFAELLATKAVIDIMRRKNYESVCISAKPGFLNRLKNKKPEG